MTVERTIEGRELRLASRGAGRFLSAGFLAFWLCGWAVGESIVLWILVRGALALLTGQPPDPGREQLQLGPAVMTGAFLLVWITMWTFGGVAAIAEFLRLVWGADRIVVSSGRVTAAWSRGPFRGTRTIERSAIRRVLLVGREGRLALETAHGRVDLSSLGTHAERIDGAAMLRNELNLSDADAAGSRALPEAWEEIITPEGERALVTNRATRRKQAKVAFGVAMFLATITIVLAREGVHRRDLAIPAAIVLLFTTACTAGALWLARGRMEWRIGGGRIVLRKRYGTKVRDVFEARRLVLDRTSDSDGDSWYALYALKGDPASSPAAAEPLARTFATGPAGGPASMRVTVRWSTGPPKDSKTIARVMDDGTTVHDLGAWLSRAADVPLDDRSTPQAQATDLAAMREALEKSGRFGKWAAKVVDQLEQRRG